MSAVKFINITKYTAHNTTINSTAGYVKALGISQHAEIKFDCIKNPGTVKSSDTVFVS